MRLLFSPRLWRALFLGSLVVLLTGADMPSIEKLPSHPEMPNPLVMMDGTKVTTKEEWNEKRKPELKKLFQEYMYGYFPAKPDNLSFKVERVDPKALGGKATLKEITISFGPPSTPKLQMLLVIPNQRKGKAPVFLGLNFTGNHTVLSDSKIRLTETWVDKSRKGVKDNKATEEGRGTAIDTWAIEQTIDAGYAVATVYYGDIDPDRKDARIGIQPHLQGKEHKASPSDWGSVAAWAWGLQRCIDYLVTDEDIDATKIIVFGHSRLGKTTLLASAFDERVAMAIPHQAGCGGTAPSRGKVGESVKRITDSFPHWFNGNFPKFANQVDRLPFDQNCLTALMAPRPVLFSNAIEDQWANPDGQFEVLKAAEPAYQLFGISGVDAKKRPDIGVLVDSTLGYWIREGKHSTTPEDWRIFVRFADKHLKTTK